MACRIACAQMDVARVRRARADLLSVQPLDGATLARAVALDRYEARALSRRKRAIWAFDAASALAAVGAERDCASPAALSNMALRWSDGSADGDVSRPRCGAPALRRCQAGLPRQADPYRQPDPYAETNKEWRRIARLFGHTRRSELEYFGQTNPRRSGCRNPRRPNEPEAAPPDVRDLGQTNPRPCRPADTVLAERTREAKINCNIRRDDACGGSTASQRSLRFEPRVANDLAPFRPLRANAFGKDLGRAHDREDEVRSEDRVAKSRGPRKCAGSPH